ncbi:MAG: MotA/TolQ/ExbB proton channel family protein [Sterolibacterium sp.]
MHIIGNPLLSRRRLRMLLLTFALGVAPLVWAQTEAAAATTHFGVGEMFMQAHIVVKAVTIFLAFCSLLTWAVFLEKTLVYSRVRRANEIFLKSFRRQAAGRDLPNAHDESAMGRMWQAACEELNCFRTTHSATPTPHQADRLLQRMALSAGVVQERELSRLGNMMGVLATIGSTSPFVGLFGTVWGILNSFAHIAVSKSTNLAVVAPGIAEALLATAIGLFAAIPAVMIYNKFVRDINGFVGALDNFSAEMIAIVSRKFDSAG